jgi:hypothetical protein
MKPGMIILCMMRGEELPSDHQYDSIPLIHAKEFEWLFWRDKIKWFEKLYEGSTIEDPVIKMFHCTTLDLLKHLYQQKKTDVSNTMVVVKVFKHGKVIDTEGFYV